MQPDDPRSDEALVSAAASGDEAAALAFVSRQAALLESICGSVTPDARARAEALRALGTSADLASIFAGFTGRGTWRTFVTAAVVDRFLFPRLLRRLEHDPIAHAAEFEAFFRREILRAVRTTLPHRDLDRDAAQWIWEQLLEDDARQLGAFAREARTPGFVIVKLKRLAQDFVNSRAAPAEGRKRALPEALADLPAFEQDVFKQYYWWRAASAAMAVLALRQRYPDADEAGVRAARGRVETVLREHGGAVVADRRPISLDGGEDDAATRIAQVAAPDPPDAFDEVEQSAFRQAVLAAASGLSSREKLCLLKRLQGKAAGEIARELGIPNPEAYDLMRKVVDKLRRALASNPAARERIATVTGNDAYLVRPKPPNRPGGKPSPAARGADR